VRGTDGRRRYAIPSDTKPARGQLSEYSSEISGSKEAWDVFQESVSGSNFAYDPNGIRPKVSFVVFSFSFSGNREGLARESSRDDIHKAVPGTPVECADVVPYREHGKHTVSLASEEHFPAIRLFFHGADGPPSEKLPGEEPPANS